MYTVYSSTSLWWILLITFTVVTEITYGVAINSFNGLTVGSGQLNGLANDVQFVGAYNGPGSHTPMPRSSIPRNTASFVPTTGSANVVPRSGSAGINSFQGNIGGLGSFRNNAGVSLIPVGPASAARNFEAQKWELYRQQMQLWAAQLRLRYQLLYSLYPYAYLYTNY